MRLSVLFSMVVISLVMSTPASAAGFSRIGLFVGEWEGVFTSGRLSALSGSDMADGSAASIMINPAPLSRGNGVEVAYDHGGYFYDYYFETFSGTMEWNDLRLSLAIQQLCTDEVLQSTAYNPEGTGRTFAGTNRMTLVGMSYDLGHALLNNPSLQWSIGSAWREYTSEIDDFNISGNSMDIGTTVGWMSRYQGGRAGITGSFSWQNILDPEFDFDDRISRLPSPRRMGLTMELAFDWQGHQEEFLSLMLAYTHCSQNEDLYPADSEHTGFEAIFFEMIALRWGHSTKIAKGTESWGLGLVLDGQWLGPFTVHADWGRVNSDNELLDEGESIWGMRVGYNF